MAADISQNIKIFFAVSVAAVAVCLVFDIDASAATQQNSRFTQKISPTYCDAPGCDLQPPVIDSVNKYNHHLKVFGKYDRLNSQSLRVKFNGVWYAYGIDPELTTDGDNWTLSLDEGNGLPLEPGDYEVEVVMVTVMGYTLTYTASLHVTTPNTDNPNDDSEDPTDPSITLLPPVTGFGYSLGSSSDSVRRSFFDSMAVSSVICVSGLILLLLAWRVNKR